MSARVEEYTIAYSETGPVVRHEMKESAETQLVLKSTPKWKRRSPANYIERLEPIWSGWSADRKALEVVVPDLYLSLHLQFTHNPEAMKACDKRDELRRRLATVFEGWYAVKDALGKNRETEAWFRQLPGWGCAHS